MLCEHCRDLPKEERKRFHAMHGNSATLMVTFLETDHDLVLCRVHANRYSVAQVGVKC